MEQGILTDPEDARRFETIGIELVGNETTVGDIKGTPMEPKYYKNGEFWIAGDLLFVNIDGPTVDTAQLKIFNIRWVKEVSLTYGV